MPPKVLVIAGPTASGKTSIGVECAKLFNGEIISADSMQIYKGMNINTAKVTEDEMQGIPHHMLDIVDPKDNFSVSEYRDMARKIIDDILSRNKLPIIVGGTGLYIRGILYDYNYSNTQKDDSIRQKYQKLLEENDPNYIYDILVQKDPEAAKTIHPNNTKRVIRALEIVDSTGKTRQPQQELKQLYDHTIVVLDWPRDELYSRINQRVDIMIEQGGLNEAEHFIKSLPADCQSMQAIGYKEFAPYFNNQATLEQVTDNLKQFTRNYAKRQITYFKGFKDAFWLNPKTQKSQIFDLIKDKLNDRQ